VVYHPTLVNILRSVIYFSLYAMMDKYQF